MKKRGKNTSITLMVHFKFEYLKQFKTCFLATHVSTNLIYKLTHYNNIELRIREREREKHRSDSAEVEILNLIQTLRHTITR